LLNDLHTLRSLAKDVKAAADREKLLTVATYCATCIEAATQAIEKLNKLQAHESPQIPN
jgi:bacterioferritin-associated ferredoxin